MGKVQPRQKGETYRPIAQVLKARDGVPTKIEINGFQYALIHPDQHKKGIEK